jgi:hypothetical protein
VVDGVRVVHALLLRIQALLLPIKTLVFSGHCHLEIDGFQGEMT